MNTRFTSLAFALALSGVAAQANAGIICAFNTPDRQSFSFGYVDGSGQPPDFPKGMYRLYGFRSNGQTTKWDEKSGGPAWAYSIKNNIWSFVSVDDTNRTITFDGNPSGRVPGSSAVDLIGVLHDAGHDYPGVCEFGGLI